MNYFAQNSDELNLIINKLTDGDTVILEDGIFKGKYEIWNNNISIKAKNNKKSILSNNDYYHKIMPNNNECNTFNTFTLYIGGDNVTLENIIIENTATPSTKYGQAVSLHVDGDNFNCINCSIKSNQDTLFIGPMPDDLLIRYKGFYPENRLQGKKTHQIYKNCEIVGDVDFIFGCGTALFENCEIISLNHPTNTFVSAPSHPKNLEYGFLFYKCNFISDSEKPNAYLARPWRDYGMAAFIDCNLGKHILPKGFNKWNDTNRDKTARFYEYTKETDLSNREPWVTILDKISAENYVENFKKYLENNKKNQD